MLIRKSWDWHTSIVYIGRCRISCDIDCQFLGCISVLLVSHTVWWQIGLTWVPRIDAFTSFENIGQFDLIARIETIVYADAMLMEKATYMTNTTNPCDLFVNNENYNHYNRFHFCCRFDNDFTPSNDKRIIFAKSSSIQFVNRYISMWMNVVVSDYKSTFVCQICRLNI